MDYTKTKNKGFNYSFCKDDMFSRKMIFGMIFVSLICNAALPQIMNIGSVKNIHRKYKDMKEPLRYVKSKQKYSKKKIAAIIVATVGLLMLVAGGSYLGHLQYISKNRDAKILTQDEQLILNRPTNIDAVSISFGPPKITKQSKEGMVHKINLNDILSKYSPSTMTPEAISFLKQYYKQTGETPWSAGFYLLQIKWVSPEVWQTWDGFLSNIPKE